LKFQIDTFKVLSARQLPKVGNTTRGEVIDPYVVVSVCGAPADCKEYKTAVIQNNGFNPTWNEVSFLGVFNEISDVL
jgi:phosphatidylinositol phospholipase C eta